MNLIVYANRCVACRYKQTISDLSEFARHHNLTLVIKRTNYSPLAAEEATKRSKLSQPFIYNETTGKSASLKLQRDWQKLI